MMPPECLLFFNLRVPFNSPINNLTSDDVSGRNSRSLFFPRSFVSPCTDRPLRTEKEYKTKKTKNKIQILRVTR